MGYYTKFQLKVEPPELDGVVRRALATAAYGDVLEPGEDPLNVSPFMEDGPVWNDGEGCKWYGANADIPKVSKAFPAATITIEHEGEDAHWDGDHWRRTWRNGALLHKEQLATPHPEFGW